MVENLNKKTIVISAVNIFEGGTLTIVRDNLIFANDFLADKFKIVAIVHDKNLLPLDSLKKIDFIEFPKSRKSYLIRLYLEYYYFNKLSQKWNPHLWFSLHDITPSIKANIRVVYCHNPSPFKKIILTDLFFQPVLFFFSLFYKYLYKINIKKNNYVVVQQNWLKNEFVSMFQINTEKLLVCYPVITTINSVVKGESCNMKKDIFTFFYPALARPFKNFEVIGEAVKLLNKNGLCKFRVVITIEGNENNYAKFIHRKYGHLEQINFIGILSFDKVQEWYATADALLFPSTLETWGLPITEFKSYEKPILLSKLPYAFETLGEYDKGIFFDPLSANELAQKMSLLMSGDIQFDLTSSGKNTVLNGWSELFNKILEK
jgi:glycosyltransferase involved in cell wall biosynthesis